MRTRRRLPWLCLGLAVLAVNLFALAGWRFVVFWHGPETAFLHFEPPPERAEYFRLRARQVELMEREAAGDPTVDHADIETAYQMQVELYSDLVRAEADQWEAARRVEVRVWLPAGFAGLVLLLMAGAVWLVPVVFGTEERRRRVEPATADD